MNRKLLLFTLALPLLAFAIRGIRRLEYPQHFPAPAYDFSQNPLQEEAIRLGRQLFYDPILSRDNSVSCASCHAPHTAFAHTDHPLSHGINDSIGTRNAPPLFNLAWQRSFMWDGAVHHLDMQALAPITHPGEMGESMAGIVRKLQATDSYAARFAAAFGDRSITGERILKALSQFQLTLVSAGARYDRVRAGAEQFTEQEQKGYLLFRQHCGSCHREPLFSGDGFADNGLPVDATLMDQGRMQVTGKEEDRYHFRIPSLRNLSYTFPYMHDGRFTRLREVLHHYTALRPRPTLAQELRKPIMLSDHDKTDLIAFLMTLNDPAFCRNPEFQYPKE